MKIKKGKVCNFIFQIGSNYVIGWYFFSTVYKINIPQRIFIKCEIIIIWDPENNFNSGKKLKNCTLPLIPSNLVDAFLTKIFLKIEKFQSRETVKIPVGETMVFDEVFFLLTTISLITGKAFFSVFMATIVREKILL